MKNLLKFVGCAVRTIHGKPVRTAHPTTRVRDVQISRVELIVGVQS
jgi:hypothetical protein